MEKRAVLTIITPTFNSEKYIFENLKSIHIKNKEIEVIQIICDGESNDGTINLIKEFKKSHNANIIIIRKKDNSLYEGINNGLHLVKSSYWSCLNSDDQYSPNSLKPSVEELVKRGGKYGVAKCQVSNGEDTKPMYTINPIPMSEIEFASYGKCSALPQPSTILHKDIIREIGLFSTKYRIAGDYDYALRVLRKHNPTILKPILTQFFSRKDSVSGTNSGRNESISIIKSHNLTPSTIQKIRIRTKFALANLNKSSIRRKASLIKHIAFG